MLRHLSPRTNRIHALIAGAATTATLTALALSVNPVLAATAPTAPVADAAPANDGKVHVRPIKTIISANFDATTRGDVTATSFNSYLPTNGRSNSAFAGMTYREDYRKGVHGNVVRTKLSAGKFVNSTGEGRGNVLMSKLPGVYDSACFTYDVRFADGFDWAGGGKLPGLVGVAPGISPGTPEGGGSVAHGWSGRLMWLGPTVYKFVRDSGKTNQIITYLYHPGQVREFGDNVKWNASFRNGTWSTIRQCQTMNTVGKADGVLQTWIDGRKTRDDHNVVFRTDPNVHITHFDWSIFRGGSQSWASPKDGYVDIDNLVVTAG